MTPYAAGRRWTLYGGDCLAALADGLIPADAAIIADPPYGIAYRKGTGGSAVTNSPTALAAGRAGSGCPEWEDITGDDAPFDPAPWLAFPTVALWGANHYAAALPPGRRSGRWLAWNKLGAFEPFGDSFSDVELGWTNAPGADRIFSLLWKGVRQGEKIDNGRRYHPSQKPVALMAWCMDRAKVPADAIVVDPYTGSGTTGVAALRSGRRFLGFEIEPAYLAIAARRLAQAEVDGVPLALPFTAPVGDSP